AVRKGQIAAQHEGKKRSWYRPAAPQPTEITGIGRRLVARNRWRCAHAKIVVCCTDAGTAQHSGCGEQRERNLAKLSHHACACHIGGNPCFIRSRQTSSLS